MNTLMAVALGGALGAMGRYTVVHWAAKMLNNWMPWGTFIVNVLGSFIIGVVFVLLVQKYGDVHQNWRALIIVGFLGAFTTFSSFSLDAYNLLNSGHWVNAFVYIGGTMLACLLAVTLAIGLTKVWVQ